MQLKSGAKAHEAMDCQPTSSSSSSSSSSTGEMLGKKDSGNHPCWDYDLAVLGTGDFGRALAAYAVRKGATVVVGSRDPQKRTRFFNDAAVPVVDMDQAAVAAKIVIAAVPKGAYSTLPLASLTGDQVLVDCSNRYHSTPRESRSHAEQLQDLASSVGSAVPVVKAFNTMSAYAMEGSSTAVQGKEVPIAGDDEAAKEAVSALVRRLGLSPSDFGHLSAASREIEDLPHHLFPQWRKPVLISFLLYLLAYTLTFFRSITVCEDEETGESTDWTVVWEEAEENWYKYSHKAANCHAVWLLSLCYLPSCLAGWLQLIRGTKYSRFPAWLSGWLSMRKQFGLLMLASATYHAYAYMLDFVFGDRNSVEYPSADLEAQALNYNETVALETGELPREFTETVYFAFGLGSYLLAATLAIASLPSVAASMTWREFRMLQSRLGWLCLAGVTTHVVFKGWEGVIEIQCGIPSETMLPLLPVALIFCLKVPLVLLDARLTRIRAGRDYKPLCAC